MILKKIKEQFENKRYSKIIRNIGGGSQVYTNGFILGYNANFILVQETDDFELSGYVILLVGDIKKIRFNKYDKYYQKIMLLEGKLENVGIDYKIDLSTLKTAFESIQMQQLNVIVECEHPDVESFTIGPIKKISKTKVSIQNFDPAGFLDKELTTIDFKKITRINFDDRYANVFGKYLRHRKS